MLRHLLPTLLLFLCLFVVAKGQDTLKQYSNQNILTIRDTVTNKISFVFDAKGLTNEQFIEMRKNLEIELMYWRVFK